MRRILYITLAIAFIFSMCAVHVSAASYDLSEPTLWYNNNNPYALIYTYDESSNSYVPGSLSSPPYYTYFAYFDKSWTDYWTDYNKDPIWSFGSRSNFTNNFELVSKRQTNTTNILLSCFRANVSNSFVIPGFRFSGVYLPGQGQFLKISFSISSQQYAPIPNASFLNYQNLFFLLPHDMNVPQDPGTVPASTVVRSRDDSTNLTSYDVYFDLNNLAFDHYSDQDTEVPFDLVIRVPYYFNESPYLTTQSMFASDCTFPSSYEILTVGGYDQAIADVQNAVIAGFDDLDKTLTEVDPDDTLIITDLDQTFDKLDDTISDYDDAMQPVFQMKELYTHPPVANIIQSNTSNLDTTEVKDFLSLPWIISAFSIIFAFCIIRLILFGTKEG